MTGAPIVGLVGGLGPESTIDYYRRLITRWQRDTPDSAPGILIDSLDVHRGIALASHDRPGLATYLQDSVRRLARAGADFVAMTANTAHLVFDEVAADSPVPLVSIVETCAEEALRQKHRRLGLLGTGFTMGSRFYADVCARHGLTIVTPDLGERAWIHDRYIGELLEGEFLDATREGMIAIIARIVRDEEIDAVILGGTELPLLLQSPIVAGVPTLDTTALHVEVITQRLRRLHTHRPATAPPSPGAP